MQHQDGVYNDYMDHFKETWQVGFCVQIHISNLQAASIHTCMKYESMHVCVCIYIHMYREREYSIHECIHKCIIHGDGHGAPPLSFHPPTSLTSQRVCSDFWQAESPLSLLRRLMPFF